MSNYYRTPRADGLPPMDAGPLDPETIKRYAPTFTPSGARFVLESCVRRKVNLDADTVLLLTELGKTDRPDWGPRTAEQQLRDSMQARGIEVPAPRAEPPAPVVEERDVDLGEEHPL